MRTFAEPEAVLPPDAEAIMEDALREEGPPDIKGVSTMTAKELRFQRRITALFTVGPLIGVIAAVIFLWGWGITALDFWLFLGFYLFTGLGVTVGFHRLFTHRSFETSPPVRAVLATAGSMSVQGSVLDWVATHRRHHAYADEYGDPHSPHLVEEQGFRGVLRGLWHAHIGWFLRPQRTVVSRWAPDLEREQVMVRLTKVFPWLVLGSFFLPPAIALALTGSWGAALTGFIWGSLVRIFLLHHVTWSINSICHFFGKQPFETKDESTNNWPLSVISFGEAWHNNHHAFPTSARHGLLRGQLDPTWRVIRTLEQLRLVTRVRLPRPAKIALRWAGEPKKLAG